MKWNEQIWAYITRINNNGKRFVLVALIFFNVSIK